MNVDSSDFRRGYDYSAIGYECFGGIYWLQSRRVRKQSMYVACIVLAWIIFHPCRWRQYVPLQYISATLHGII
jgi:hypothetical protein